MKLSLKEKLLIYFGNRPGQSIPSGEIQRLVAEKTSYTPSNVSRRLRELQNEGKLRVSYVGNHAHYQFAN